MRTERYPFAAIAIVLVALIYYTLTIFDVFTPDEPPSFGGLYHDVFNYYYLTIMEGRLDLPMRVLRIEGHYTPEGLGFVYHGVGPLLTRFATGWFIPLEDVSLIRVSILLWTTVGTAFYHVAFHQLFMKYGADQVSYPKIWAAGIAACVWFASPGVILVSNTALTHETISLAYAMTAGFVFCLFRVIFFGAPLRRFYILMAIFAAVTVHARPNVAAGLYAGMCLATLVMLWTYHLRAWRPMILGGAILIASGLGYLELNSLKFGDSTISHGSYEPGPVQYGSVYWGFEPVDSDRAQAYIDNGRFNLGRLGPNLVEYTFSPPGPDALNVIMREWFYRVTERFGYIRKEWYPGVAFLWVPWVALAGLAVLTLFRTPRTYQQDRPDYLNAVILFGAAGAIMVLIGSYGTLTVRYRTELWPLFVSMAAFGSLWMWGSRLKKLGPVWALMAIVAVGMSVKNAAFYRTNYFKDFEITQAQCEQLAQERKLAAERIPQMCAL